MQHQRNLSKNAKSPHLSYHSNISGLPIDESTWEVLFYYAQQLNPKDYHKIQRLMSTKKVKQRSYPNIPEYTNNTIEQQTDVIQKYLSDLQYNFTGTQFFKIDKLLPFNRLMYLAYQIMNESLPIKCVEAVLIGIYLTNDIENLERFSISFMSYVDGEQFRHIVLGLFHKSINRFGCIGISRRPSLMNKPFEYKNLFGMIKNFQDAYKIGHHNLIEVTFSEIIPHDNSSSKIINWNHTTVNLFKMHYEDIQEEYWKFCRNNGLLPRLSRRNNCSNKKLYSKPYQYHYFDKSSLRMADRILSSVLKNSYITKGN